MDDKNINNMPYVGNVFYKLSDTARVSELMARNYYKIFISGHEQMLELDEFKIFPLLISLP